MVEQNLAGAGKLFDDLASPIGGSATSSFPYSSCLTKSMISIESFDPQEEGEHYDRNTYYQQEMESEAAETVKADGRRQKSPKQIGRCFFSPMIFAVLSFLPNPANSYAEYHGQKDQSQHGSVRRRAASPLKLCMKGQNGHCESPKHSAKSLYGTESDQSSDLLPSPPGSSVVVHTGHSIDTLETYPEEDVQPVTRSTRRRRLRNLMGL